MSDGAQRFMSKNVTAGGRMICLGVRVVWLQGLIQERQRLLLLLLLLLLLPLI
jgi:hypothetical protein